MTFKDKFPNHIEFDIQRDTLCKLYRWEALCFCGVIAAFIGLLFGAMLHGSLRAQIQDYHYENWLTMQVLAYLAGLAIGSVIGAIFYFGYFHRAARLSADNLRVLVEGPFLRVVTGSFIVVDQRFHFEDIQNYTTIQGPIQKRLRMKSLSFRQNRGGPPIFIQGLSQPDVVRDILSELDAQRSQPRS